MSDRDSGFAEFVAGFIIGGLAGAAVALLLAPQSGEETRQLIRDKSIVIRDQVEETAAEARQKAEELASQAKDRAQQLTRKGQVVLEEAKAAVSKPRADKPA